jgi:hypothetical protein
MPVFLNALLEPAFIFGRGGSVRQGPSRPGEFGLTPSTRDRYFDSVSPRPSLVPGGLRGSPLAASMSAIRGAGRGLPQEGAGLPLFTRLPRRGEFLETKFRH